MAFTAPRTWTDGELVTKAIMDPHIRDNFLAMPPHLIARKTSDQSVTSSTVLVNDTALLLPLLANEVWDFRFVLIYEASTAGDFKVAFTFPTSGDLRLSAPTADPAGTFAWRIWSSTTSPSPSGTMAGSGAGSYNSLPLEGVFVNAGNAGNLQLQFAQGTSDATPTTIKANSTVWGVKLA